MNFKILCLTLLVTIFFSSCKKFQPITEQEGLANISNPKLVSQKTFELKYPSNWEYQEDKENKNNTDFKSYLIESNGNSYIQILIYEPAMDNQACVEEFKSEFENELIETEKTEERNSWGKQSGYGLKLFGKILFSDPGTINLFCFTEKDRTYAIVEFYYETDFEQIKTGLFLVQSSFKLF